MTPDEYLREVSFALRDLPWGQRRDLVADLRHHLAELPPETDLVARLGKPERYASDLRAAEGLERRSGLRAYLRSKRRRNVVLVTLLVVVLSLAIGLAIGVVDYVDGYEPLHWAGGTALPLTAKSDPYEAGYTVYFHKGKPFQYGILIENSGRFAVHVLGATAPGYSMPLRDFRPWVAGHLLMSKNQSITGAKIECSYGSIRSTCSQARSACSCSEVCSDATEARSWASRTRSPTATSPSVTASSGGKRPPTSQSTSRCTSASRRKAAALSRSGARQVLRPAGRDPRRGEANEERRRGRTRQRVQLHPDLLETPVALA